jgi:hypothetical protein
MQNFLPHLGIGDTMTVRQLLAASPPAESLDLLGVLVQTDSMAVLPAIAA